MKHLALACVSLFACADSVDKTSETESYATNYQATNYQATNYQATNYQATNYQATNYQGAKYGSTTLTGATIDRTALSVTRTISGGTETRYPDRICTTTKNTFGITTTSCTATMDLRTTASPLAGVTFDSSFIDPKTQYVRHGTLMIGWGTSEVGAVQKDSGTWAGFPLKGHGPGADPTTTIVPYGPTCGHPDGCHTNSDLFLYEVFLVDTDGHLAPFCAGTNQAIALAGTWDYTGERTSREDSRDKFTFACVQGTIAKCVRWGYRSFGVAKNTSGVSVNLSNYHQACVRAATADYCANGHSYTRNHTLIDVYDFEWQNRVNAPGLIPRTQSVDMTATAFVGESVFDRHGASEINHMRYDELVGNNDYGSLSDPDPKIGCKDNFSQGTINYDGTAYVISPTRWDSVAVKEPPYIYVANTHMCSHSEQLVGRYLNANCSDCTRKMFATYGAAAQSCFDAHGAWTQDCVDKSSICSGGEHMAVHSECTVDSQAMFPAKPPRMGLNNSACTIAVCSQDGYEGCCNTPPGSATPAAGLWDASCVAKANEVCTGGQEHASILVGRRYGFCNTLTSSGAPSNAL